MGKKDRIAKWIDSDNEISDQVMREIISALDNKDKKTLKKQFSKSSVANAAELDKQISDLMDFYEGTMVSFEGHASSDTLTNHGEDVEKSFIGRYKLVTDKATYRVMYDYKAIDKKNPEQEGLKQLELVTQAVYDEQVNEKGTYRWIASDEGPGIYMKE